jgi:hypothetical protein
VVIPYIEIAGTWDIKNIALNAMQRLEHKAEFQRWANKVKDLRNVNDPDKKRAILEEVIQHRDRQYGEARLSRPWWKEAFDRKL